MRDEEEEGKSQRIDSGIELPVNLRIIEPLALPGSRKLRWLGSLNAQNMKRSLTSLQYEPWDVLIFNDPRWAQIASQIPAHTRIFDAMDDLSASSPNAGETRQNEILACKISNRVWTGTSQMAQRLETLPDPHPSIHFIPCGVDAKLFANPSKDEIERVACELQKFFPSTNSNGSSAKPLAGYFGALNERFNMDLLRPLLQEGWRVLLIGPGGSSMPAMIDDKNLRWIGLRPYSQLPAYLAQMDLALIPYSTEGPNRFLYPVKALEYLAGGKPVLSTPLPDVIKFLNEYLLIADSPEAWRKIAREWNTLKSDAQSRAQKGRSYAQTRSWENMIEEMTADLALVESTR